MAPTAPAYAIAHGGVRSSPYIFENATLVFDEHVL